MKFSVLILTYNEEINIEHCVANALQYSDDVVVLDSFSTDATKALCEPLGIRFVENKFAGYASQRNHGLQAISYKHEWLLMLDADELITEELAVEVANLSPDAHTMYRFRRKDYFMGRWIKRSSGYPTWFGRLFRLGQVTVEREINEEYKTSGTIGYLDGHLLHYPFSKGLAWWVEKHNRYSSMEAEHRAQGVAVEWTSVFSLDPVARRAAQKQLLYRLPLRPYVVFAYLYLFKLGFLDGVAGLKFARLRLFYEFLIDYKFSELKGIHKDD